MIDRALIRYAARRVARRSGITVVSAPISIEDLEQESALASLRGRKSIDGPMQDALKMARPRVRGGNQFYKAAQPRFVTFYPTHRFRASRPERAVSRSIETAQLMLCLNNRERGIVHSLYWQGFSVKELAQEMGVTAGRVSQIKTEILEKLRGDLMNLSGGSIFPNPELLV